jgi:hypothetical protein
MRGCAIIVFYSYHEAKLFDAQDENTYT